MPAEGFPRSFRINDDESVMILCSDLERGFFQFPQAIVSIGVSTYSIQCFSGYWPIAKNYAQVSATGQNL